MDVPTFLSKYGTEFSWEDFVESNNKLVATHSLRSVQAWAKRELRPGQALRQLAPLFKKLDESVLEEEYARLEG